MRFIQIISFSVLALLLSGCNESPLYSKKIEIDGNWNYDNVLIYPIEIDQLDLTYDLVLSMTYGTDFGYQNIYVKITTKYPNEKKVEDILSLKLTNGTGIFLGDCNSSKCKIDILLQERFKFKEKGAYEISIAQNGREENLESIYSAELQLFKNTSESK